VIITGQDATGRWAWMLLDDDGKYVASQDDYYSADAALTDAARTAAFRAPDALRSDGHRGKR
jgi:hypothetical protein